MSILLRRRSLSAIRWAAPKGGRAPVGFLNWFENKVAGELTADYGPLSTDAQGVPVSASLRQKADGTRYLVFKWEGKSTLRWVDFHVTPAFLDHLSAIVQDARARLGAA